MDKHSLIGTDICEKFIGLSLARAGWDAIEQVLRECPLRPGRMVVRGQRASRDLKAAGFNLDQTIRHTVSDQSAPAAWPATDAPQLIASRYRAMLPSEAELAGRIAAGSSVDRGGAGGCVFRMTLHILNFSA